LRTRSEIRRIKVMGREEIKRKKRKSWSWGDIRELGEKAFHKKRKKKQKKKKKKRKKKKNYKDIGG